MKWVAMLVASALLSSAVYAECVNNGFGPGPTCDPPPVSVIDRPSDMCFPDGCRPITYTVNGLFVIAQSELPNGFQVLGYAGPCHSFGLTQCPAIYRQAAERMRVDAEQQNRAQGYLLLP